MKWSFKRTVVMDNGRPRACYDLCGERFGRLVVVTSLARGIWSCLCDCGVLSSRTTHTLLYGARSCGCLRREVTAQRNVARTKPVALSRDWPIEHVTWRMMVARCLYPTNTGYANYGARGITVCLRWRDSFAAFLEDMGPRPSSLMSIDRINNLGNYEPGNCRWSTGSEQARNTRRNHIVEFKGERLCLTAWAEKVGINKATLFNRVTRQHWPIGEALTRPARGYALSETKQRIGGAT